MFHLKFDQHPHREHLQKIYAGRIPVKNPKPEPGDEEIGGPFYILDFRRLSVPEQMQFLRELQETIEPQTDLETLGLLIAEEGWPIRAQDMTLVQIG